jgi:hypothetical protein
VTALSRLVTDGIYRLGTEWVAWYLIRRRRRARAQRDGPAAERPRIEPLAAVDDPPHDPRRPVRRRHGNPLLAERAGVLFAGDALAAGIVVVGHGPTFEGTPARAVEAAGA